MKELLAEIGDFKIGGRIINKVRFSNDMVNRLIDTGRKYGMEINIDKSQVMSIQE